MLMGVAATLPKPDNLTEFAAQMAGIMCAGFGLFDEIETGQVRIKTSKGLFFVVVDRAQDKVTVEAPGGESWSFSLSHANATAEKTVRDYFGEKLDG